jgi:SAM-dependent methyltransferase
MSAEMLNSRYKLESDPRIKPYFTDSARRLAGALTNPYSLDFSAFRQTATESIASIKEKGINIRSDEASYLNYHIRRFWETDSIVNGLLANRAKPNKILDLGFSANTIIIKTLFPDSSVFVADLPQRCNELSNKAGLSGMFHVDLTQFALHKKYLGHQFDVIIFAEVLEHLPANPLKVLQFLLRHLSLQGYLILTTPNLYTRDKLRKMALRINPTPAFPPHYRIGQSQDHIRLYCMSELLELIDNSGGTPVTFFFSECWKTPYEESYIFDDTNEDLVVVASTPQIY